MAATTTTPDEREKESAPSSGRHRARASSERGADPTAEASEAGSAAPEQAVGTAAAGSTEGESAVEPTAEASATESTAVERAAAPGEAVPSALRTMSRMIYVTSYAIAYGIVYAAVFAANSLPQDNPVMRGFRDGGQAAVDELSKAEQGAGQGAGSEPVSETAAA